MVEITNDDIMGKISFARVKAAILTIFLLKFHCGKIMIITLLHL